MDSINLQYINSFVVYTSFHQKVFLIEERNPKKSMKQIENVFLSVSFLCDFLECFSGVGFIHPIYLDLFRSLDVGHGKDDGDGNSKPPKHEIERIVARCEDPQKSERFVWQCNCRTLGLA